MSQEVSALIVFCEGAHDSGFVRQVMRQSMGFAAAPFRFSELPYPLDRLFPQSMRRHAADDLTLDMAHKFMLPDSILRKGDRLAAIFNTGGKDNYGTLSDWLSDFLAMCARAGTFASESGERIAQPRFLFLYDANDKGLDEVSAELAEALSQLGGGQAFIAEGWQDAGAGFGRVAQDKAVFVWGESPASGTLEDMLLPLAETGSAALMERAHAAMKAVFGWELDAGAATPDQAKYKKAVLTTAGQRAKPGGSLTVVMTQSGLVSDEALASSEAVTRFVQFVEEFWPAS